MDSSHVLRDSYFSGECCSKRRYLVQITANVHVFVPVARLAPAKQ